MKVTIVGAAGGIGQPLSLLAKQSPHITELALYDIVPAVVGVAADISHISTPSVVTGYTKENDGMQKALEGAEIVVIPAGVPRKPGMTRDDLFKINAGIVRDIANNIAKSCPNAMICVISNPVNSTVPIVAETLKRSGCFNAKRLFGVTTLDVVRASTFSAQALGKPGAAADYNVPVYGGHSGVTILPILSQANPKVSLDQSSVEQLTHRIQFGGDEVVKAKDGAGSATLSMAYAGYRFVDSIIQGCFLGKQGVIENSFVYLEAESGGKQIQASLGKDISVFSVPIELGRDGVAKIHALGDLSDYEKQILSSALPELENNIAKGASFATANL